MERNRISPQSRWPIDLDLRSERALRDIDFVLTMRLCGHDSPMLDKIIARARRKMHEVERERRNFEK